MRTLWLILFLLVGCTDTQSTIDSARKSVLYFKDTRPTPPICFAYVWGGGSHGGPGLATVPCAAVEHLLVQGP